MTWATTWKRLIMSFGSLLREHRLSRRLSQGVLAERAGLSIEAISSLERGFRRNPQRYTIEALARALELSDDALGELRACATPESPQPRRRTSHLSLAPAAVADTLPNSPTRLIGREKDLATLGDLIEREQIVTIVGAGGIGKTRVAVAAARARAGRHPGGVTFVDLAPARTGDAALQAVATAIRANVAGGDDATATIARELAGRDVLIVLDNCEQVASDVARLLGAVVARAPKAKILATSRDVLHVAGAATFRLTTLAESAAVELFVERARAQDASFAVTPEVAAAVKDICNRLDGIALAIELAATRTRSVSPLRLRTLMSRRLAALTLGPSDRPSRQQTLAALIDWSYQLLTARERACLAELSVFGGSFTFEAAAAVTLIPGEDEFAVLDLLDSLVAKSLVMRDSRYVAESRYTLLETVREFASERLAERADARDIRRRFVMHARAHVDAHARAFEQDPRLAILESLIPDYDNTFAALDAALALEEYAVGAEILTATPVMDYRARFLEVGNYAQRFAERLDVESFALHARLSASIGLAQSYRSTSLAMDAFERGLVQARRGGDPSALAYAMEAFIKEAFRIGQVDVAVACVEEYRSLPDPSPRMAQRLRLFEALRATYQNDRERAVALFDEIVTIESLLGNESNVLVALLDIAEAEHARGNTERALEVVERARALCRNDSASRTMRHLYSNAAGYLAAVGRIVEAREAAFNALAHCGSTNLYAEVFVHLSLICGLEGHDACAAVLAGFTEARHEAYGIGSGEYTEWTSRDRLTALLAQRLRPERERALRAAGRALDFDRAVALARDPADVFEVVKTYG